MYNSRKNGGPVNSVMKCSLSLVKHDKSVICSFLSDTNICKGNKSVCWPNHNTDPPPPTHTIPSVWAHSSRFISLCAICFLSDSHWMLFVLCTDVLMRSFHQTHPSHTELDTWAPNVTLKPVLSRWGIFVAITKNTLYGSKLFIFMPKKIIYLALIYAKNH